MMKDGQGSFTVLEPSLNRREFEVRQLQPYTKYTFKVSAINIIGVGNASQASNTTLQDGEN